MVNMGNNCNISKVIFSHNQLIRFIDYPNGIKKTPSRSIPEGVLKVAGAGFEPATSGL